MGIVHGQQCVVQFRDMSDIVVILFNVRDAYVAFELPDGCQSFLGLSLVIERRLADIQSDSLNIHIPRPPASADRGANAVRHSRRSSV